MASSDEWYTPPEIVESLGAFDLDPATSPLAPKHAKRRFFAADDGLSKKWTGRVWLNPPFSDARPWIDRLREHGNGIALVFARTDAKWFIEAISNAGFVFMMLGRVRFLRPERTPSRCPLGCVLIPFGAANIDAIKRSGIRGVMLKTR